jgi:hypothetical protein
MAEQAEHGNHVVPAIRMDQVATVLALGTRAALLDLAGAGEDERLFMLAIFLRELCQKPRNPRKMAAILRVVASELLPDGKAHLTAAVEAVRHANDCFELAFMEGWNEALSLGDFTRLRDIWDRRLGHARDQFAAVLDNVTEG